MTSPRPRPFSTLTLDHLVLRVEDLPRMRAFYEETLGCPCVREEPARALWTSRWGRAHRPGGQDTPLGGEGPIHHQNGNLDRMCPSRSNPSMRATF